MEKGDQRPRGGWGVDHRKTHVSRLHMTFKKVGGRYQKEKGHIGKAGGGKRIHHKRGS